MQTTPKDTAYGIDVPGREVLPGLKPAARSVRARIRLRISDFCFVIAGLAALMGMTMGIVMGVTQDFTIAPAHAHLNLLGWVTMAIYGLYHRGIGRTGGFVGWVQVICGALGASMMSAGLAIYLGLDLEAFVPLVYVGSLLAFLSMLVFVVLVVIDLLRVRRPEGFAQSAHSG